VCLQDRRLPGALEALHLEPGFVAETQQRPSAAASSRSLSPFAGPLRSSVSIAERAMSSTAASRAEIGSRRLTPVFFAPSSSARTNSSRLTRATSRHCSAWSSARRQQVSIAAIIRRCNSGSAVASSRRSSPSRRNRACVVHHVGVAVISRTDAWYAVVPAVSIGHPCARAPLCRSASPWCRDALRSIRRRQRPSGFVREARRVG
jgi:hypothetical protein